MTALSDDFDRHVRRVAPDRWLAARLIADAAARTEVLALYALDDELAKIAPAVSQPMLGAIRLQWWREALERAARGGAADHPVIEALAPALRAGRLRPAPLEALIASHEADLEPEPFADDAALVAWLDARFGSVMALAAGLLDPTADGEGAMVHATRAWGWSRLAHAEGVSRRPAARVRAEVETALAAARPEVRALPVAAFPAVAYATLARVYARGREPSELGRRARLLWASARGRL